jgi:hypothetical protein
MNPGTRDHYFIRFARCVARVSFATHLPYLTHGEYPISPHPAMLATGGLKVQSYINEAVLFVF